MAAWQRFGVTILLATAGVSSGATGTSAGFASDRVLPWHSEVAAARARAQETGKHLFIELTGSDWSIWCKRLESEVFAQPEFVKSARERYVFLLLDFPRGEAARRAVVDPELNERLRVRFGVVDYPTVVLATPDMVPIARTGYQPGGPAAYLRHLDELDRESATIRALWRTARPGERQLTAAFPLLRKHGLLGLDDYARFLVAAEKLDPDGRRGLRAIVLEVREQKALDELLRSQTDERSTDWRRVADLIANSPHLRGAAFVGPGMRCADWLLDHGDARRAEELYRRLRADPSLAGNERALKYIDERIAAANARKGGGV